MRFDLVLLVRPSISEALADDAFRREFGALEVGITERGARVVTEVELGKVTVQVLFLAMLIDGAHSALEDRKVAFDRVGGDRELRKLSAVPREIAADIFLGC